MAKVLVTGGTGFVGGAIVRELVRQGRAVRVLARPTSKTDQLEALGVEIARGDILDRGSVVAALADCGALYHAAAIYDFSVKNKDSMLRTEVEGTRNAMEAALTAGVRKVVYTSTAATIGEARGEVGTETTKHRGYFITFYERAKYEAERVAESYLDKGLEIVTILPAAVIGPGDLKPTGQSILGVLNGRFPAVFEGALSFVDVNDVAVAHVKAEAMPAGERFIVAGRTASNTEFLGLVAKLGGVRMPWVVPVPVARIATILGNAVARLRGKDPMLPRDSLELSAHGFRVDGSKAGRELELRYTPFEDSLRRAIEWYGTHGYWKRSASTRVDTSVDSAD